MQGNAAVRGRAVAIGRNHLTQPVLAKGAEDEKVAYVCSGRRRACDAGTGGGSQDGHQGATAAAAEPVGRGLRRVAGERLHLPRHHAINHQPSVSAYYEPRYSVTKDLQLYAGIAARASRSRTAPPPRSISTPASGRPSTSSRSISVPSTTGTRAGNASTAASPRSSARIASPTSTCRSTVTSSRPT